MKLSTLTLSLSAILLAPAAFAGVLQLEDSASQVCAGTFGGNCKTISKGGKLVVEGRTTNLVTVAAGLRSKAGLFPVYVGELLVNDNKKYVCDKSKAFSSLKDLSAIAVRLQFARSIGMDDLKKAFNDGFDNNDVNVSDPSIVKFLAGVTAGGDIPDASVLEFSGEKLVDGSEAVTYVAAHGKVNTVVGPAGSNLIKNIFGLWLGNPGSDGGLKHLNENFTTCQIAK